MKNSNLTKYVFILIFVAAIFFTACNKDDEFLGPDMTIDLVSTDANGWKGDTIMFQIMISSDGDLTSFQVSPSVTGANLNSQYLKNDFAAGDQSETIDYSYIIPSTVMDGDKISLGFTVTDANQLTEFASDTIYIVRIPGPIVTYDDKILGSYSSNYGSSFCSSTGVIFSMLNAWAGSDSIDFLYFYGAANLATIAAPNDTDAEAVFNDGTIGLEQWTTRNATMFKTTTLTATEFDAISNDISIIDAVEGANLTKITEIAENDVIAFKTAATSAHPGKQGLIKVYSITTGAGGDINISVKVQSGDK